ncbi:winged helix-turn-helix domain-containing protein [Tenacibaculum sp. MEBiC06402]|uniref:winged helix-turn-helix domain-containing protein n=1 Tax=unclassified Tenacibaculum TaxID=2635139 RepID=UPI003B992E38
MNKFFPLILVCGFILSSCGKNEAEFSEKVKLSLRNVGHQLLLSQKDSTTLVLPIKQIHKEKYKLTFQKDLQIEPSQLVNIINENFKKSELSNNYLVEVENCIDNEVAYSFEMFYNEEKSIIPCSGRNLPNNCYVITVKFISENSSSSYWVYLIVSLFFSGFIFLFLWYKKKYNSHAGKEENDSQRLGSFLFYPEQNKLVKQATEIPLSKKECELLSIFISRPNQIIKREELTKKVWEDNGVFVGRSLDTYISKIRKKIKEDSSIRLVNVHGVGYKLEVD